MSVLSVNLTRSAARPNGYVVLTLYVLGIGIAVIPILTNKYPSINDYLNHLSRSYVLLNFNRDQVFSNFFIPHWQPIPDLGLDLWIIVFGQIFTVAVAGKLFIVTIFVLLVSGVILLHRVAFGKWSLWPLLSLVLLYNRPLLSGVLNFLFGVALWLHALALWIYLSKSNQFIRAAVLCLASLVIFFVHLFAFGILVVTIAAYELVIVCCRTEPWPRKAADLVAGAVPFLPALAILAFFSPHDTTSMIVRYRDLWTRIAAFAAPLLYEWQIDAVCYLTLGSLFAWAVAAKAVALNRPLAAGVVSLFALQFITPNVIMTAEAADHRFPIPMMLLGIAAADPNPVSRSQRLCFAWATVAFFVFRIAIVETRWHKDQRLYEDAQAGLSLIPDGALVATANPPGSFTDSSTAAIALFYLPAWLVIPHGGFTQTLFAVPTQHPLVAREKYAALAAATPADEIWRAFVISDQSGPPSPSPALVAALRQYDYVIFLDSKKFTLRNTLLFKLIYKGQYAQIYRINTASRAETSPIPIGYSVDSRLNPLW